MPKPCDFIFPSYTESMTEGVLTQYSCPDSFVVFFEIPHIFQLLYFRFGIDRRILNVENKVFNSSDFLSFKLSTKDRKQLIDIISSVANHQKQYFDFLKNTTFKKIKQKTKNKLIFVFSEAIGEVNNQLRGTFTVLSMEV